jgi:hypothetical protein
MHWRQYDMENWNVMVCKRNEKGDYYLLNKNNTLIRFTTQVPFNMGEFLSALEDVHFPLEFTTGIDRIRFRRMKDCYGTYDNNSIEIGVKKHRPMKIYVSTFIHEVAHHIDSEEDYSEPLDDERKVRGKFIHEIAQDDTSEYFARGFEDFYSSDPKVKSRMKKKNPKLYRTIQKLHRKYSSK